MHTNFTDSGISSALSVCHSSGILHRDVKSTNIFFHPKGYKLGDFDFSMSANNPSVNERCGTLSTMAPEVYCGQLYDHRSDIYSLGIILKFN